MKVLTSSLTWVIAGVILASGLYACSRNTTEIPSMGVGTDITMTYPPAQNGLRCAVATSSSMQRLSVSCVADPSSLPAATRMP